MARVPGHWIASHRPAIRLINAAGLALAAVALSASAAQIDIPGPAGSSAFGATVTVLPNGNIVVTDPGFSAPMPNVGAVYLYSPADVLISTLTGSSANDRIGNGGITVLDNGNYVIASFNWDNDTMADAGAVTWANGDTGVSGVVSAANSLVGTTGGDMVGIVTALANGNYVVASQFWDNATTVDVGAVTWASGSTGLSGAVAPANSLIGTTAGDFIGGGMAGVTALANGNYVVNSALWDNGSTANVGATTWANGNGGLTGQISQSNSLIGSTMNDNVGSGGVTELANGNYVIHSTGWDDGVTPNVGAVTWANGGTALSGVVSPANSLVGSTVNDLVGFDGVTALVNGNYVVGSSQWDNGGVANAGATTWANGTTGLSGVVAPANSLIGSSADDQVGDVTALSTGNYVVSTGSWDDGATENVGAVTWASGSSALSATVAAANSLIGSTVGDQVGSARVVALSNGNYVVGSFFWDNGVVVDAGAATWVDGSAAFPGVVSTANSLVGTTENDGVGSVTALVNGNYVVSSPNWDNGGAVDVGASTWGNGASGISGAVSTANSLIGNTPDDQIGNAGVIALANGNYVVSSFFWNNGGVVDAGAVTWVSGSTGLVGMVATANSLVGTTTLDLVGLSGATALSDGNYAVASSSWDDVGVANAGAVTLARGGSGLIGTITPDNSVRGTVPGGGSNLPFDYDAARGQLVVGRRASNIVSLLTLPADLVFGNGFESP